MDITERTRIIEESRRRCAQRGQDAHLTALDRAVSGADLDRRLTASRQFLEAAARPLEILQESLADCGSVFALTDPDCCVLRIIGSPLAIQERQRMGIRVGLSLEEESCGTAAVNIALRLRRPFYLAGHEYYLELLRGGACYSAPVVAGGSGIPLGATVLMRRSREVCDHTFTLVKTVARVIGQESGAASFPAKKLSRNEPGECHYTFDDIVGLDEIKARADNLARQDVNILLSGETGTGKEMFAQAIHGRSGRSRGRFVAVNCGAIPETLFESELFGFRRGAFTDARSDHAGKIAFANEGTLFLDEIGDLPLNIQGKLLRVLETKAVCPLGSNEQKRVDVRFIFATNRDLAAMVRERQLRPDLFYRINTPAIAIPALRERRWELPRLIMHLLKKMQDNFKRSVAGIDDAALKTLMEYDFPGNVRELESILKCAYITCPDRLIKSGDLAIAGTPDRAKFSRRIETYKARIVYDAYVAHGRDAGSTGRALGLSSRQIYRYLKRLKS